MPPMIAAMTPPHGSRSPRTRSTKIPSIAGVTSDSAARSKPHANDIWQCARMTAKPGPKLPQSAGPGTSAAEVRPQREFQRDPGEALPEVLLADFATAYSWVVEVEVPLIEAFQDYEVIEFPEQNQR